MRLTHFGHSCLLAELDGTRLLFDPGTFADGFTELTELDGILITHQHPDHVDVDKLPQLLESNPQATLLADASTAEQLGSAWTAMRPGDQMQVGTAVIEARGGRHAVIHPDIPVVDNVAYLVNGGALLHPGDALHVPDEQIDVLALPAVAPWMPVAEAIDYFRAVAPRLAVPIHQAISAVPELYYGHLDRLKPDGSEFRVLEPGVATSV